jgi:prepilin signal peptidase PulO-like enzyme (type II secretory pathway)
LLSVAAGLSIGLILHYGYLFLRKKDALGWGDVKFMAMVGTWLPVHDFVTFFLFAGLMGTLTGLLWRDARRGGIFPFGPALAVSLFINELFPDIIGRIAL